MPMASLRGVHAEVSARVVVSAEHQQVKVVGRGGSRRGCRRRGLDGQAHPRPLGRRPSRRGGRRRPDGAALREMREHVFPLWPLLELREMEPAGPAAAHVYSRIRLAAKKVGMRLSL